MKFTLNWLKDHLDTRASLDEIATTLTRIGLEVEGIENPAEALAPFVVGEVVEAVQHPNADRLRVCQVNIGKDQLVEVVCGAPNARTGLKTAFAAPGSVIPRASANAVMVDAVPIVMQKPGERAMPFSTPLQSSYVMLPAHRSVQNFSASVPLPSGCPFQLPRSMGPAGR